SLGYRVVDTGYSFSKPCLSRHSQALKAMQEADSRRLETILIQNPDLPTARIPEHDKQPTLLHKLSETPKDGRPQIASTLLKHGAAVDATDVDPRGPRALREAILSNHLELVRVLLDHGADPGPRHEPDGRSPLSLALLCGHSEIAKSLVKYGAEPSPAESAGLGRLPKEDLVRALSFAAINNQFEIVKKLLESGVDPNLKPLEMGSMICTPLHRACSEGHQSVVEVLLKHGADPEVTDDVYDATPLIWARYNERPEIASLLENLPGDVPTDRS
ncbi:MAG: ankyrin repeat domain-containing protein, partial [Candidatus Eremiobacteraeota bacterium]|nr:ankyrin repeat domain-containing protein [Candidatus Eremiobacteraeota bacterium]